MFSSGSAPHEVVSVLHSGVSSSIVFSDDDVVTKFFRKWNTEFLVSDITVLSKLKSLFFRVKCEFSQIFDAFPSH